MAYRRRNPEFDQICEAASFRAGVAYRTVNALLPDATNRTKMRIARKILSLCDGKDRSLKISPAQLQELVMPNWQCIDRDCPACFFWEPMSRAINEFFNED
jgi:hypothetical protein